MKGVCRFGHSHFRVRAACGPYRKLVVGGRTQGTDQIQEHRYGSCEHIPQENL